MARTIIWVGHPLDKANQNFEILSTNLSNNLVAIYIPIYIFHFECIVDFLSQQNSYYNLFHSYYRIALRKRDGCYELMLIASSAFRARNCIKLWPRSLTNKRCDGIYRKLFYHAVLRFINWILLGVPSPCLPKAR
ncbi:hypothetical protein CEXT_673731 [Caerostris extrusa]|uniref:Maturase K n=1 Tax=Caerostris extrusa TaxID=172846 RepID=A0AAV4X9K9_CAEEX|nr:hypothetical protein CEXT_673731 [Caerostris extrusa]